MSAMADETFEEATIDVFGSSTVISDPIVLQVRFNSVAK